MVLLFLKAGGLEFAYRNTATGRESWLRGEAGERDVEKAFSAKGTNWTLYAKCGP